MKKCVDKYWRICYIKITKKQENKNLTKRYKEKDLGPPFQENKPFS